VLTDFYMININVRDLDRSVEFYTKLGFAKVLEFDVKDPEVGGMFGLDGFEGLRFAWMKLEGARKGAPVLDLVEFTKPRVQEYDGNPRTRSGMARLSFRVDDIDAQYAYLRQLDVEFVVPLRRRTGPDGAPLAVMWFLDPDQTVIEVLQVGRREPGAPGEQGREHD
jgi:catechol 2,3-dioxygenase-like lactoylglutathione lyase family enzyme